MLRLPFGRRDPFGARAVDEVRLLHEAAQAYPGVTYADLTNETLVEITAARGVDFATALFYDRIRRSPEHGAFIARTESLDLGPAARHRCAAGPSSPRPPSTPSFLPRGATDCWCVMWPPSSACTRACCRCPAPAP
jgi:hypothetical protein